MAHRPQRAQKSASITLAAARSAISSRAWGGAPGQNWVTTPGMDAVLVSVDSLAALEKAYPNYFADTRVFLELLRQTLAGQMSRVITSQLALPFD